MQVEDISIQCPYCGESLWLEVDPSAGGNQSYIEDCQVCCRPIRVQVMCDENGECAAEGYHEDA